ncbi:MAG TPA: hypothetical protein VKJ01_02405, partial [Candidatus Solibacter sp.]|nr:hypothetical protein [Candidatus Solibacter sp.]
MTVAAAQDDAVVAENANIRLGEPQTRGGAFSRAGMSQEEMTAADFIHDSDGVDFQALAARQAMDHQDFVERIFERIDGTVLWKEETRELEMAGGEIAVEPRRFVGRFAWEAALEIQAVAVLLTATFFEERPEAAGMKKRLALRRRQLIDQRDTDVDVAIFRRDDWHGEFVQRRIERQQNVAIRKHTEGNSANLIGDTVGNRFFGAATLRSSAARELAFPKQLLGIVTMQFGGHRCVEGRHGDK